MQRTGKRILYGGIIAVPIVLMVVFMNVLMMRSATAVPMLVIKNLLALVLIGVYVYYVFLYHRHLTMNKLLFLIVTSASMITIGLLLIDQDYLFMPMLIAAMMIAIVIDRQLAIMTHIVSVLIVGIFGQLDVLFYVFYITVGIVASLLIVLAKERNKIFLVAAIVSAFNAVFYNIISYVLPPSYEFSFTETITAAGNGAFTIILVIGSLPLWETIFQVVTPLKLLEFVNSDHKLMQRLLLEAPGTYHHSQMVSNLAERAATHVGADALLARTGALYHDIGKLKEPMYFIENQDGRSNPHDDLAADASARIIIDHVDYGVKLGREHKLPRAVVDIIQQHHGTSLVGYFYHKAQKYDDGVDYDESLFRYSGPKPQTNEAGIVMLADCVEAYVRSLNESDRDLERIQSIIKEVIDGKFKDHQLEECDLKIRELPVIADAFIQVYNGMYHERVKYPTNGQGRIERQKVSSQESLGS